MKQIISRVLISLLIFFFAVTLGIYFRRDDNPVKSLVKVEMTSYYVLYLSDGDSLCFSESTLLDRNTTRLDSLEILRDISSTSREAQLKKEYLGYRVSREGRVQVALPSVRDTLAGQVFKESLLNTVYSLKQSIQLTKHHLEELEYYHKTHTVVDDGYNEVMSYAEKLNRSLKNDQSALLKLDAALKANNPIATRQSVIKVNNSPYICVNQKDGLADLMPYGDFSQLNTTDAEVINSVLKPKSKNETISFLDSIQTYFSLSPDSLGYTGTSLTKDGIYYEGGFDSLYRKDGFGFQVDHHFVKCGIWKKNQFQGERMIYTSDRVYGIDISRYQHEIGKKKYPILWDKLRIRHLGTTSNKRIQGKVDYPVSFLFIKATEGTSVRNRYFDADLKAARKHRLPVAAYHFFSPRPNGAAQAKHFLKFAKTNLATLPPMLDVEPSHAEIQRMGGIDVLFREVLIWLRIVEKQTAHRPLLYISQSFVNRYMGDAPEALKEYSVWVARYGEFKPYVKLLLWQLSPDGRVEGIRGDVDINVFNGSKADFKRWVERYK